MADMLDYLYWRGDLGFDCLPFGAVDGLILAWFASLGLKEPLPATVGAAALAAQTAGDGRRFAEGLARSARFRDMPLYRFEENFSQENETQFAAVTILTGDGAFIAFRGTDGTLTGWKEDFNMAFMEEVPAQHSAVKYINRVGGELGLPLRVGGHSKGGNLAVYGAAMCAPAVQRRIRTVYNFDGPGLNASAQSEGFGRVESRIETFLPESSVVGILLERTGRYHVVKSDAKGVMQHSPYTWQVQPEGFVLLDSLAPQSLYADRTLRSWLDSMSGEDRRTFVNALYEIVEASDAKELSEISWETSGLRMLEAFRDLDIRKKAVLALSLGRLIRSAVKNINP